MISQTTIKNIQELLSNWFCIYNSCQDINEINMLGFLKGTQKFNENFVPVLTICRLGYEDKTQSKFLKDCFNENLAIFTCSNSQILTHQNQLFKLWIPCGRIFHAIYLKDKLYYIGYGCLLDNNLRPLILATYSVKQVKQSQHNCTLIHHPALHITPELFLDTYWKKIIIEGIIPIALTANLKLQDLNRITLEKNAGVIQKIDVKIHDLSEFLMPLKNPPLSMDVSKELNSIVEKITQVPKIVY